MAIEDGQLLKKYCAYLEHFEETAIYAELEEISPRALESVDCLFCALLAVDRDLSISPHLHFSHALQSLAGTQDDMLPHGGLTSPEIAILDSTSHPICHGSVNLCDSLEKMTKADSHNKDSLSLLLKALSDSVCLRLEDGRI